MKLYRSFIASLLFSLVCSIGFAQNTFNYYPTELGDEPLIILEYQMMEPQDDFTKSQLKDCKFRNEKAKMANEQLQVAAKEYPFEYIIAKRSALDSLKEKGYRLVLENDMMKKQDNPEKYLKGNNANDVGDMYILNMENGDKYFLFQISQSYVFFSKGVMKKFIKQVKRELY
ncbi:MAG: hypothetical protein HKN75_00150 [Bacteroidia bacterium]|nr:hypothetical protein [Bacteroidia bacterium]